MNNKNRTIVELPERLSLITKESKICSLGSCFSDEIGRRLKDDGYDILINPFGVLYNPLSIANSLHFLDSSHQFSYDDIIERDPHYGRNKGISNSSANGFTSFYHHGSFTRPSKEEFLEVANSSLRSAQEFYANSDTVIITFGTNSLFEHIVRRITVSNCHKHLPSSFERKSLSIEQIVSIYSEIIMKAPNKLWVFTVSPIRYTKDGLRENQISKSILHLAIDEICRKFTNTLYLPSYETVMDELRDYSFYAEDLKHPNNICIEFVYEKMFR